MTEEMITALLQVYQFGNPVKILDDDPSSAEWYQIQGMRQLEEDKLIVRCSGCSCRSCQGSGWVATDMGKSYIDKLLAVIKD